MQSEAGIGTSICPPFFSAPSAPSLLLCPLSMPSLILQSVGAVGCRRGGWLFQRGSHQLLLYPLLATVYVCGESVSCGPWAVD